MTKTTHLRGVRIATFLFHDVVDRPEDSGFQRAGALPYKHRPDVFLHCMDAIAAGPVMPTTVNTIDASVRGDRLLLTFDDGGISAMRIAAILDERGWKGHFLVTTSLIGTKHFLGRAEIVELHRRGHIIGSHSHTHPDIFYDLSDEQMVAEWMTSVNILSDVIGEPVVSASVPGGDMDKRVPVAAGKAGIRYLFTSEPTTAPWLQGDVMCFGRACPRANTPVATIAAMARFRGFKKAMAIRRIKQAAKRMLGSFYRRRVASAVRQATSQPQGQVDDLG